MRRLNETLELRISERTAQLESNEAQMRAIFETSHQYQALLNHHGDVLHANKIALTGIRAEAGDVIGRPFWETPWFTATDGMRDTVRDAFIAVMRGEEVKTEMRLHLPVGERYFDFAMRPLRDQHGTVIGAVPEAVDITERRKGEEALRQSQKMEAVGQLTGGVAHDFNNLLTIIRSATDFLRRRDLPDDRRRRYIDAISDTVERASKLTGQLLAFARRQPLKPQVFDVGAQVEAVAQLVRPLVGSRIRIEVDISDAHCFAIADIAQFETALINLAVNARDAMNDEGRLSISVRKVPRHPRAARPVRAQRQLRRHRHGGHRHRHRLRPYRGDLRAVLHHQGGRQGNRARPQPGLRLRQAIRRRHRGRKPARTRCRPSPSICRRPRCRPRLRRTRQPRSEPAARGRGYRVLVVEDNDDVGQFSTELLEDLGYTVRRVDNADAALAILGEDEFAADLVFSDVIMPGMNGVELAGVIRDRYPGLPVVLTSGYSNVLAENAHRGFELIQKPYSVEALSRILAEGDFRRAAVGHFSLQRTTRILSVILRCALLRAAKDE